MKSPVSTMLALALLLTGCGQPASPPSSPSQVYLGCVGADHGKATQRACQVLAWGEAFEEDDERWLCDHMGNWECAPNSRKA
jgi:hypothetical protein